MVLYCPSDFEIIIWNEFRFLQVKLNIGFNNLSRLGNNSPFIVQFIIIVIDVNRINPAECDPNIMSKRKCRKMDEANC